MTTDASSQIAADIAAMLHDAPVFDGHNDLPWALREKADYDLGRANIAEHQPDLHTDIPRLRAGGVGAQFFSVFVPGTLPGSDAVTATLEQIDCVRRIVATYPDTFAAARTADEVRRAIDAGKIAALMGAEGGHSIDSSLGVLRTLRALGVAYMTLTHNQNTPWADSATDEPAAGGLTAFGREVVTEMNRIGMLVDLSHVAPSTMRDAIATSTAPVIFSHSSCRAVTDHVRDVPDDVLATLPGNGGVVMLTFVPAFVSQACADYMGELAAERERLGLGEDQFDGDVGKDPAAVAALARWREDNPEPVASISDVVAHINHAREMIGVDHLGLGGDYDGVPSLPVDLDDVSHYPALLAELAETGWSMAELAKLTSGNILRVLGEAEQVAEPGFGV